MEEKMLQEKRKKKNIYTFLATLFRFPAYKKSQYEQSEMMDMS